MNKSYLCPHRGAEPSPSVCWAQQETGPRHSVHAASHTKSLQVVWALEYVTVVIITSDYEYYRIALIFRGS